MDTVVEMVQYMLANATMVRRYRTMKETQDDEFNDSVFFANAH